MVEVEAEADAVAVVTVLVVVDLEEEAKVVRNMVLVNLTIIAGWKFVIWVEGDGLSFGLEVD